MSKKEKPFHVSILKQLRDAETRFSKHANIGMFISRFVTEVETITTTIASTEVPKEHLPGLISNLEFFYQEFEAKYPRNEDAGGSKRDRTFIDEYFANAIASLNKRLAA